MYIIYNADGSINKQYLNEFIQEGNSYANVLFVAIIGREPADYYLNAFAKLPNNVNIELPTEDSSLILNGITYVGKNVSITSDATTRPGSLQLNIVAENLPGTERLVSFNLYLTVNETGLAVDDPAVMTIAQYQSLLNRINEIDKFEKIELTGTSGTLTETQIGYITGSVGTYIKNGYEIFWQNKVSETEAEFLNTSHAYKKVITINLTDRTWSLFNYQWFDITVSSSQTSGTLTAEQLASLNENLAVRITRGNWVFDTSEKSTTNFIFRSWGENELRTININRTSGAWALSSIQYQDITTPTAQAVTYDNSNSGLAATNVQGAIDKTIHGEGGKNLIDINKITENVRYDDSGNLISQSGTFTTDYIEIQLGMYVSTYLNTDTSTRAGAGFRRAIGFDENKNFVELISANASLLRINNPNIKYVRLSYGVTEFENELMLCFYTNNKNTQSTEPYEEYDIKPRISEELLIKETIENKEQDFYISTGLGFSDLTTIGDKLVCFAASDTGGGRLYVIEPNLETKSVNIVRNDLRHNFGHMNTVDYNADNDCLIFGNGSGQYIENNGKFYIMKNPYNKIMTAPSDSTLDLSTNTIEFDCTSLNLGYKLNACWGYTNYGQNDIAILITNDNGLFTFVKLGKGNNQLDLGNYIPNMSDDDFNGTFKIIKQFNLEGRTQGSIDNDKVNQGSVYYDNHLYVAVGHSPHLYWKIHFAFDGIAKYEEIYEPFVKPDGATMIGTDYANEGITICRGYKIFGLSIAEENNPKLLFTKIK